MPRQMITIETQRTIGNRVKEMMNGNDMNDGDLADVLDVTTNTINRIKNGKIAPGLELLIDIANHFRCSVDYLLGRSFK